MPSDSDSAYLAGVLDTARLVVKHPSDGGVLVTLHHQEDDLLNQLSLVWGGDYEETSGTWYLPPELAQGVLDSARKYSMTPMLQEL